MTKILFIGDIFGKPGRKLVFHYVPQFIKDQKADFVIANAENAAGGKGITPDICYQLFDVGVDVITTGNHISDKKEIIPLLESEPRLLRPMNFSVDFPGAGSITAKARNHEWVSVINAIGCVHVGEYSSPFACVKKKAEELKTVSPTIIVDFHAEATSEKRAMGWHMNGLASAVLGTHTHVQTADEEILNQGTAYISDVGMTGPHESVIGLRIDLALERFLLAKKKGFDVAKKDNRFCAVIVHVESSGCACLIERIHIRSLVEESETI